MSEKDTNIDNELIRLYELAFHVVPTEGEDGANKVFEEIKKIVESKGKVVSESNPSLIKLQYTMVKSIDSKNHKHNTAYFAWIKFEAESLEIESIEEELSSMESVLRYMIVKSEKETDIQTSEVANFLSGDKKKGKGDSDKSEDDSKEDSDGEENEEKEEGEDKSEDDSKEDEIDEAIDELVEEEK